MAAAREDEDKVDIKVVEDAATPRRAQRWRSSVCCRCAFLCRCPQITAVTTSVTVKRARRPSEVVARDAAMLATEFAPAATKLAWSAVPIVANVATDATKLTGTTAQPPHNDPSQDAHFPVRRF